MCRIVRDTQVTHGTKTNALNGFNYKYSAKGKKNKYWAVKASAIAATVSNCGYVS
jgi:hypothetical protein